MRPTDYITVTFEGFGKQAKTFVMPYTLGKQVRNFAAKAERTVQEKLIPARQVLPELADDEKRPAIMLRAARRKAGLTQKELAAKLGIKQHHLSEMETGKRSLGKQMAQRIAKVLRCDYRLFI